MKKLLAAALLFSGISSFSMDYRIGIGGTYSFYESQGEEKITGGAGYVTINAREIMGRVLFSTGFDIHYGRVKSSLEGSKSEKFGLGNYHLKVGFNPFGESPSTFFSVVYSWDWLYGNVNRDFETGAHLIGLDLHTFIKGNKVTYEYGVGYHYVFHSYHYLDKTRSGINDFSYAIDARVGYTYELSPKVAYFINARGKYYSLAESKLNTPDFNRPKTEHVLMQLEVGLQF